MGLIIVLVGVVVFLYIKCRWLNNVVVFVQAARLGIMEVQGVNFAEAQINYMLGGGGHSFVVGFGSNPPLKPHHAGASCGNMPATCDWANLYATTPNPQVLYFAITGQLYIYCTYRITFFPNQSLYTKSAKIKASLRPSEVLIVLFSKSNSKIALL
jgi:hypothetical protein